MLGDGRKKIVFKVGGSLLYDDKLKLQVDLLAKVRTWYYEKKDEYSKIVIFVGGGKLSRWLGGQVREYDKNVVNQHGIGLHANILNAQILKSLIGDEDISAPSELGKVFEHILDEDIKTVIAGGLKKGWSTDMDISFIGDMLGLDKVYKLSEIDRIYTADPDLDRNAKPIEKMTWEEYYKLFGIVEGVSKHQPNQNLPIDFECAQFSKRKKIVFFVSGGKDLHEKKGLGEVFEAGTMVYP